MSTYGWRTGGTWPTPGDHAALLAPIRQGIEDNHLSKSFLSTHGLSKTFGSVKAISNVAFSLAEEEIHAIIGPNGAGKSTLVKLLSGEITPDAGGISLNGESVVLTSPACARSHGIS